MAELCLLHWVAAPLLPACAAWPSSCPPSRFCPRPADAAHGACWYDLCEDCQVVDIPGDHFSILRQVGRQPEGHRAGALPGLAGHLQAPCMLHVVTLPTPLHPLRTWET